MVPGEKKKLIIIGGGAAGFFAAINAAQKNPDLQVTILEKTNKLLSKVKISGGGRCNVTHNCSDNGELVKNYPRGEKELRQVFSRFSVADTVAWFEKNNVRLKTEADGRMFPVTDSSQTIIDCFLRSCDRLRIRISTGCEVFAVIQEKNGFQVKTNQGIIAAYYIVCASGGHHKAGAYDYIKNLGHTIDAPIPSLFTFNLPGEKIQRLLQGVSVERAEVSIKRNKLKYQGPVLITHWGLSGPAVLKLSAFAAHALHESEYRTDILVNWVYPRRLNEIAEELKLIQKEKGKQHPRANPCFDLPRRLWEFLCEKAGIPEGRPWAELGNKTVSMLAQHLTMSEYHMNGKTTFKEEFVTCGGVNLKEVDFKRMESKIIKNLFFCGEVLNIDGITGGFNFQSAWSTAWICADSITE